MSSEERKKINDLVEKRKDEYKELEKKHKVFRYCSTFKDDVQVAAWLLFLSSFFYVGIYLYQMMTEETSPSDFKVCFFVTFLVASFLLLIASGISLYNAYQAKLAIEDGEAETSFTTVLAKYVWRNPTLLVTWIYVLAIAILLIYPIWAEVVGDYSLFDDNQIVQIMYILVLGFVLMYMIAKVVSLINEKDATPEEKFNSSIVYSIVCCCSEIKEDLKKDKHSWAYFWAFHCGDYVISYWVTFIVSILFLALSAYTVYFDASIANILILISGVFFCVGSGFMTYASYGGFVATNFIRSYLCFLCDKTESDKIIDTALARLGQVELLQQSNNERILRLEMIARQNMETKYRKRLVNQARDYMHFFAELKRTNTVSSNISSSSDKEDVDGVHANTETAWLYPKLISHPTKFFMNMFRSDPELIPVDRQEDTKV